MKNYINVEFPSIEVNEAFARATAGVFATQLEITMEELEDIKTAVSEAVTNAIIHGYCEKRGIVKMKCEIHNDIIEIEVSDDGCGIPDVSLAMQPLYSNSKYEERSGMGFTVMQSFMDTLSVKSEVGKGTKVIMTKKVGATCEN